ncbi:hypothetical protein J3R82DRAFT_7012 [Butyriboletus roseoflavus]|nr:hypothetical protein J3R82DRAFT_7012 [Butyriboletus roseoflavus]
MSRTANHPRSHLALGCSDARTRYILDPHSQYKSLSESKPLPELSQEVFSVSRTLETQLSIGFPKRPRANAASQSLPDGLYKGRVQLSKGMLPSMDWPGITVKVRTVAMHGD